MKLVLILGREDRVFDASKDCLHYWTFRLSSGMNQGIRKDASSLSGQSEMSKKFRLRKTTDVE